MSTGWTHKLSDPLIEQAEKILSQRQARNLVIDPDLLGEPGWDILLCLFIASGRGWACNEAKLVEELQLPLCEIKRWLGRLCANDMITDDGMNFELTLGAKETMRKLFAAQMSEMINALVGCDGLLQFSSGSQFTGE